MGGGGGLVRLIFFKDRLFGRAICQQQGVPFRSKKGRFRKSLVYSCQTAFKLKKFVSLLQKSGRTKRPENYKQPLPSPPLPAFYYARLKLDLYLYLVLHSRRNTSIPKCLSSVYVLMQKISNPAGSAKEADQGASLQLNELSYKLLIP